MGKIVTMSRQKRAAGRLAPGPLAAGFRRCLSGDISPLFSQNGENVAEIGLHPAPTRPRIARRSLRTGHFKLRMADSKLHPAHSKLGLAHSKLGLGHSKLGLAHFKSTMAGLKLRMGHFKPGFAHSKLRIGNWKSAPARWNPSQTASLAEKRRNRPLTASPTRTSPRQRPQEPAPARRSATFCRRSIPETAVAAHDRTKTPPPGPANVNG